MRAITFRPLTTADLPLLQEWIARPHVAERWDEQNTLAELEAYYAPSIAGSPGHQCYIAMRDAEPIGFIQSYTTVLWHHEGWWLDEHDPGVRGIDPAPDNPRAIRCYEKAGFRRVRETETADGPILLMYCDRP